MEATGLLTARPYQEKPVRWRYALTPKGRDLGHVLAALAKWGSRHVRGTRILSEFRKS